MKLEVHTNPGLFTDLKSEWNELVRRSTANCIFSTWEWQSTWWACYQPGDLWVLSCRDDEGRLVGLAPWFIGQDGDGRRVVATIGCKEVTDYLDLIVDPDHTEGVLEAFVSHLAQSTELFDYVELCNIPEGAISLTQFPAFLEKHGFQVAVEPEDVCPVVRLPQDWSEYLTQLDKKQRHEIRRKLRRAQGVHSGVDWYIVGPEHNIEEEMEHFFLMMAASAPEKAQFLADPQNKAFFKAITTVLQEAGWLSLSFLTVEGERASTYLNFDYEGKVLVYNSGLQPESHGYLSPGIVLLAYNIQHAIETGHEIFDFLQGNETYKYHMGGQDIQVLNLRAELAGRA